MSRTAEALRAEIADLVVRRERLRIRAALVDIHDKFHADALDAWADSANVEIRLLRRELDEIENSEGMVAIGRGYNLSER